MTDQNNLARLIRNPATGEMEWLKPSIDDLDLASLPQRLDDATLERVEMIARSPLPVLPSCDSRRFDQSLRMMLAVLPRRQADDLSGELFVAAYERQLGHYPDDAIRHLCDEAVRTCKWFPTVAECLEILTGWRRLDAAVMRQSEAQRRVAAERRARFNEERELRRVEAPPLAQEQVDAMDERLIKIGLGCGALIQDDEGNIRPAPETPQ